MDALEVVRDTRVDVSDGGVPREAIGITRRKLRKVSEQDER